MVPEGDTESGHREKAKVNETQSRRRWFKGGLANSEGGQPEREEAGSGKAGSTWVLQVGDTPTLENTEDMGLMGEEDGLELCSKRIRQTNDYREDPGPRWAAVAVARLGPPPPPRLQHHPQSGKRKCFWRRSPGGEPEGLGFPKRRGLSTSSLLGIKPQCTTSFDHHHPLPGALGLGGPMPPVPASLPSLPSGSQGPPGFRLWPCAALRPPAPSSPRGQRWGWAPPSCSHKPPASRRGGRRLERGPTTRG